MEWQTIILWVMSGIMAVGGYLYRELKTKVDKTHEDFLVYRAFVASTYVSNDDLKQEVANMVRSVDNVAAGVLRIEARMNAQIDRRSPN